MCLLYRGLCCLRECLFYSSLVLPLDVSVPQQSAAFAVSECVYSAADCAVFELICPTVPMDLSCVPALLYCITACAAPGRVWSKVTCAAPERVSSQQSVLPLDHKVLKYIEHHSVCPLVGIGTPPPL
jgi:hypothetical protein